MKKFNYRISLIILLIISSFTVSAQENTRWFSLKDVLEIAKKQSPDALMAKHKFRSSFWEYKTFKADYLPSLILNGTLPSLAKGVGQQQIEGETRYFSINSSYESLSLSLEQEVGVLGGSLSVSSNLSRSQNHLNDVIGYIGNPIIIEYTQPLFQYNEYKWARRIEPIKYLEAKSKYLEDVEQVSITAVNYFFNLLLAQIEKEIAIKNRKNYDTLYHIALGRFNLGKIAENDLLQLELNLLRSKSSIELAELELSNSIFLLKSFLRIKDDVSIKLIPPLKTLHFEVDAQKAINESKKNSSTEHNFEKRLLEAASTLNMAKVSGRFDANIVANYGLGQKGSYFKDVYIHPDEDQNLSLGISVPILDWGKSKGRIKMAESRHDLETTSIEQERVDFVQNIYLKVVKFNMQKSQLFIAAKSDTVAQKRYEITQQRYLIGKLNDVLELNSAQIDSDRSQKEYFRALQTYWINYFELRKRTLYDFEKDRIILFDIKEIQE